jgi:tetratricopeptide (TPR) repeat protein
MKMLIGDSRQMFANHFFVKADIYFHGGYYPSIFDQARQVEERENHMAAQHEEGEDHDADHHEEGMDFLTQPTDWIDRFGRHFRVTEHEHLAGASVREILPWLRISAALDPHRIETYTVAAYWLRSNLGKVDEAEQFLREGMKANPQSYEIPYELGRLYDENRHDSVRALNLWKLALRRWQASEGGLEKPNYVPFDAITVHLAKLEEEQGHYDAAIKWLQMAEPHSPNPAALRSQIEAIRQRQAAAKATPASTQ